MRLILFIAVVAAVTNCSVSVYQHSLKIVSILRYGDNDSRNCHRSMSNRTFLRQQNITWVQGPRESGTLEKERKEAAAEAAEARRETKFCQLAMLEIIDADLHRRGLPLPYPEAGLLRLLPAYQIRASERAGFHLLTLRGRKRHECGQGDTRSCSRIHIILSG